MKCLKSTSRQPGGSFHAIESGDVKIQRREAEVYVSAHGIKSHISAFSVYQQSHPQ